jgi:acetyl esterase/lipase
VNCRRPNRAGAALLTLAFLLGACAGDGEETSREIATASVESLGAFPSDAVAGLRTDPDITYTDDVDCGGLTCRVPGDVIAPSEASAAATVVLLGGGSTAFENRRYQQDLAVALAERGAVVFLLSYRSAATGNYDSDSASDARCAVNYARDTAAAYGGDPDRVVIVGHSMGGLMGLDIVTQGDGEAEGCLADGTGIPDAVIGLGAPRPRSRGSGEGAPPIWLFAGSADGDADGTAQLLRDQGFDAQAVELEGVSHDDITQPTAAPEIVDLIMEALESL